MPEKAKGEAGNEEEEVEEWQSEEFVRRLERVEEFQRQAVKLLEEAPFMVRPPVRVINQLKSLLHPLPE